MAALALVSRPSSLADRVAEVELIASTLEAIHEAEGAGDGDPLAPEVIAALEAELISAIAGTREKVDRTAAVLAMYEDAAESAKREAARLAARAKWAEAQWDRLAKYVMAVMTVSELSKLEGRNVTLALRAKPPAVVIDDDSLVPADFMRVPPPPAAVPDKLAIKAALKGGAAVAGCRLHAGKRLEVR